MAQSPSECQFCGSLIVLRVFGPAPPRLMLSHTSLRSRHHLARVLMEAALSQSGKESTFSQVSSIRLDKFPVNHNLRHGATISVTRGGCRITFPRRERRERIGVGAQVGNWFKTHGPAGIVPQMSRHPVPLLKGEGTVERLRMGSPSLWHKVGARKRKSLSTFIVPRFGPPSKFGDSLFAVPLNRDLRGLCGGRSLAFLSEASPYNQMLSPTSSSTGVHQRHCRRSA